MRMYKDVYFDTVNEEIIKRFDNEKRFACTTLFEYAAKNCKIDGIIAAAKLLSPDFVCVNNYVFIKNFWNYDEKDSPGAIAELERRFNSDKKLIEMHVNSWSLGDFFLGCDDEVMDDEAVLTQFGRVLKYYWERRAKEAFPERRIKAELGNSIMGEYGLTITMFEEK